MTDAEISAPTELSGKKKRKRNRKMTEGRKKANKEYRSEKRQALAQARNGAVMNELRSENQLLKDRIDQAEDLAARYEAATASSKPVRPLQTESVPLHQPQSSDKINSHDVASMSSDKEQPFSNAIIDPHRSPSVFESDIVFDEEEAIEGLEMLKRFQSRWEELDREWDEVVSLRP